MIDNIKEIKIDQLAGEVQHKFFAGYRFVTATCVDNGDESFDIYYHFDKGFILENLKIKVSRQDEIPSISKIYFSALLVENEIKELFGVNIKDILIDYGGHLLLSDDAPTTPMAKNQIEIINKGDGENA